MFKSICFLTFLTFLVVFIGYTTAAPCDGVTCPNIAAAGGTSFCVPDPSGVLALCVCCIGGTNCGYCDACSSSPCLNGGTCTAIDDVNFICTCASGFGGNTCANPVDPCASDPCNGGSCTIATDNKNLFQCVCPMGCFGYDCSNCSATTTAITTTTADLCSPNPCKNGGTCSISTDNSNLFQCVCPSGCFGFDCSSCPATTTTVAPLTACSTNPCKNGGICNPIGGSLTFTCTCPPYYYAYDCSVYSPIFTIVPPPGPTAAPPRPVTCSDCNPTLCQYYASMGLCSSNAIVNGGPIQINCPRSCNLCGGIVPTKSSSTCVDSQASCYAWRNYCPSLNNIVPHPCPATCGRC